MNPAMDCAPAAAALPLYLDGELDAAERSAFERHLGGCARCQGELAAESALQSALRAMPRPAMPAPLAQRVCIGLPKPAIARPPRAHHRAAAALAAGLALLLIGGGVGRWALAPDIGRLASRDLAVRDAVAAHIRALVSDRITDVSSSDGHTVMPWFNGRVELAPPVADLTVEGFPLVGGRVDFVDGRRAAALVYRRRQHVISLFVWPSPAARGGAAALHGFNMVRWFEGGAAFSAVSDLNREDLARFADLVRARAARAKESR